jgi:hypothetical protein
MTPDEARELREISEMFDYQLEIVVKEPNVALTED